MSLKNVLHLILILGILILAGAAAGQAAAPISAFDLQKMISESNTNSTLDEVFLKNDYLQIKYIFKIIEVTKETQKGMRLKELFLDNNSKESIYFYNREQILEFLDQASLNNLKVKYRYKDNFRYLSIEPEIIVSLFERASIEVNEEILNISDLDKLFRSENKLSLSLITKNISEDQQIITTDFIIETNDNNYLNTSLNIVNGKENLVGMLVIKNNKNVNFKFRQNKLYVVYLKAISINKLSNADSNKIINLDGLNNIVSSFSFDKSREKEKYIVLYLDENYFLKSKIVFNTDYAFYFEFKENEYAMVGIDKNLFSELNLEFNIYTENGLEYYFSLGVNEEIKINPYFSLGVGIYPIVYELKNENFQEHYYWYWVNAKIFVFNDKNKIKLFYQQNNNKENFRMEISREFLNNLDLILANEINNDRKGEWELGLKWKF